MMYKTKALDVAAYIYSQGHDCTITPIADSFAEFTFKNKGADKLAEKFRKGDVVMSIARFTNARTQLKQLGSKALSVEKQKINGTLWNTKQVK